MDYAAKTIKYVEREIKTLKEFEHSWHEAKKGCNHLPGSSEYDEMLMARGEVRGQMDVYEQLLELLHGVIIIKKEI